jgi:hypothetical protein
MEVELVNVFVEKQRDVINDLMARNILLDAKLVVTEKQLQKIPELSTNISNLEVKLRLLQDQNNAMNALIENYKRDIESFTLMKEHYDNQQSIIDESMEKIKTLEVKNNQLTLEKEAQRVKTEKMKKRAQELITE